MTICEFHIRRCRVTFRTWVRHHTRHEFDVLRSGNKFACMYVCNNRIHPCSTTHQHNLPSSSSTLLLGLLRSALFLSFHILFDIFFWHETHKIMADMLMHAVECKICDRLPCLNHPSIPCINTSLYDTNVRRRRKKCIERRTCWKRTEWIEYGNFLFSFCILTSSSTFHPWPHLSASRKRKIA